MCRREPFCQAIPEGEDRYLMHLGCLAAHAEQPNARVVRTTRGRGALSKLLIKTWPPPVKHDGGTAGATSSPYAPWRPGLAPHARH